MYIEATIHLEGFGGKGVAPTQRNFILMNMASSSYVESSKLNCH